LVNFACFSFKVNVMISATNWLISPLDAFVQLLDRELGEGVVRDDGGLDRVAKGGTRKLGTAAAATRMPDG
jgi:hypothetical protein